MIQLSLALVSLISPDLMKMRTMEDAMEYLKDFPHIININPFNLFENALKFTQVTP